MNTTIKILAIIALLTACAAPAALGTTYTWRVIGSPGDEISWSDEKNWLPPGRPQAGDTAILPEEFGVAYTVRISGTDEECEILQVLGGTLEIKGQVLTLGNASGNATTSTIDANVDFFKDASGNKAELKVRGWVSFDGTGTISAKYSDNQPVWGTISRASNGTGIKILETVEVKGHMQFLVSIQHDNAAVSAFATSSANDVMKFGWDSGAFTPDLEISTTTPASARSRFDVPTGRLEFYSVKFGIDAPNWFISSGGAAAEIDVDDLGSPHSAYFVDVPFDIAVSKDGLLDFHHDFSCNGTLTLNSDHVVPSVRLDMGLLVRFYTPTTE